MAEPKETPGISRSAFLKHVVPAFLGGLTLAACAPDTTVNIPNPDPNTPGEVAPGEDLFVTNLAIPEAALADHAALQVAVRAQWNGAFVDAVAYMGEQEGQGILFQLTEANGRINLGFGEVVNGQVAITAFNLDEAEVMRQEVVTQDDGEYLEMQVPRLVYDQQLNAVAYDRSTNVVTVRIPILGTVDVDGVQTVVLDTERDTQFQMPGETLPGQEQAGGRLIYTSGTHNSLWDTQLNENANIPATATPPPADGNGDGVEDAEEENEEGPNFEVAIDPNAFVPEGVEGNLVRAIDLGPGARSITMHDATGSGLVGNLNGLMLGTPRGREFFFGELVSEPFGYENAEAYFASGQEDRDASVELPAFWTQEGRVLVDPFQRTYVFMPMPNISQVMNPQRHAFVEEIRLRDGWMPTAQNSDRWATDGYDSAYRFEIRDGRAYIYIAWRTEGKTPEQIARNAVFHMAEASLWFRVVIKNGGVPPLDLINYHVVGAAGENTDGLSILFSGIFSSFEDPFDFVMPQP